MVLSRELKRLVSEFRHAVVDAVRERGVRLLPGRHT